MDEHKIRVTRPPPLTRITCREDLDRIVFVDDVAEVEVPVHLLGILRLKHDERLNSPRLEAVMRSIRRKGYSSLAPIICKIGARGRWVVMDGGHRLTALRMVSRSFWVRLFRRDLGDVTFILYRTQRSGSKIDDASGSPGKGDSP